MGLTADALEEIEQERRKTLSQPKVRQRLAGKYKTNMQIVVVSGSSGLVGSEVVQKFCGEGFTVVGIDNDMRQKFFGPEASTAPTQSRLESLFPDKYIHHNADIRDHERLARIFQTYSSDIKLIVHTAAQPSHDWASSEPITDFTINANGTLVMLECTRKHCPESAFVFCSTNKVYGDTPNRLPFVERSTRWEIEPSHRFSGGIDETMSIDASMHSVFGASKTAADVMVQEYGRYFGMKTAVFRGGCLTGENHAGARLHGFLSYVVRCVVSGADYAIYGYKGKQVRDNLHSSDLVNAFYCFFKSPRVGEIYNIGGGRDVNCSVLEAIDLSEKICGKRLNYRIDEVARAGDHRWWISDTSKFRSHYPDWKVTMDLEKIIQAIYSTNVQRWV